MNLYRTIIQFEAVIAADNAEQAGQYARMKPEEIAALLPPEYITVTVLGTIQSEAHVKLMASHGWDLGCVPMRAEKTIGEFLAARQAGN